MDVEQFAKAEWHQRTPHVLRRILRALLVDLLVLLTFAVVGEGAVRRFFPEQKRRIFTAEVTGGYPKTLNARGLRDRDFPDDSPPQETRILVLGASHTFGTGVAMENTYPKQLERLLNARGDATEYFVINAGGEGQALGQTLDFLLGKGLAFDPVLVIQSCAPSMIAKAGRGGDAGRSQPSVEPAREPSYLFQVKRALRRGALGIHNRLYGSYLYGFLDGNVRLRLYRLGVIRDRMDKASGAIFAYAFDDPGVDLQAVEENYRVLLERLVELKKLLDEHQIQLLVMTPASRFDLSDRPVDNERGFDLDKIRIQPAQVIGDYCTRHRIPFVDPGPRLRAERHAMLEGTRPWNDLYIPLDYSHLNPTGLHIVAEELLKEIEAQGWLPDSH